MDVDWLKNLARLYLPVYLYESDTIRIAYVGYSSIKKAYFIGFFLNQNIRHSFLGRRPFWKVPDLIKSYNLDIVISEISPIALKHFQEYNGFIIPEWITMKIYIDCPIGEVCKKSASHFSDVLRLIRKYNLTYEILSDKESFNYFNEKLYLPYITKRHGEEAWIEDLSITWNQSPTPLLIAVKEDGVIVGESLIRKSGDSLRLMRLGLLDGNDDYLRHGVIGALYYFSILEGQKSGCRYIDLGGTRPFLTDGLTKFKSRFGGEFEPKLSSTKEYIWLGINEHSGIAKEFMRRNPVMYARRDFSSARSETG
jgi:hypothetical protein